jgi:hypothetical protein
MLQRIPIIGVMTAFLLLVPVTPEAAPLPALGVGSACAQAGGTCCYEWNSQCWPPGSVEPQENRYWRGDGQCCNC